MDFIGSDAYYTICATALAVLVVLLIGCQVKTRRPPRKTPPPPPGPEPTAQKPRYAAGDNMDRINRNAHTVVFGKKHSDAPAIIGSAIIGLLIFLAIPQIINTVNQETNSTSNTVTTSAPTQTTPTEPIEMEIVSTELNEDHTKLFVTYRYINNSARNFKLITPTIYLQNADEETIQTMVASAIDLVAQGETKEITSVIEIEPENMGKIANVRIHTSYYSH